MLGGIGGIQREIYCIDVEAHVHHPNNCTYVFVKIHPWTRGLYWDLQIQVVRPISAEYTIQGDKVHDSRSVELKMGAKAATDLDMMTSIRIRRRRM